MMPHQKVPCTYLTLMRSHYLWPRKSQNHTIPVNLEAIQTTTITIKLFQTLYLGYNTTLSMAYDLAISTYPWHLPLIVILRLISYLQI